jgi:hypothetical protein
MAEALKKAAEVFSSAPQQSLGAPSAQGHAKRSDIVRAVKRFESNVSQWSSDLLLAREGLSDIYKHAPQFLTATAVVERLGELDEFIEHVGREVEAGRIALRESQFSDRQVVSTIMKTSQSNAEFMRKMLRRLYKAGVAQQDARVSFYEFLVDLKERNANQSIIYDIPHKREEAAPQPVAYSSSVHRRFLVAGVTLVSGGLLACVSLALNARLAGIVSAVAMLVGAILASSWLGRARYERSGFN